MLSDVLNLLFQIFENNSHLFIIILFPFLLGFFTSICTALRSFSSSSSSSALPEDADAYVLDPHGVLVPVYSFDRGD